jgi:hypothetical protein
MVAASFALLGACPAVAEWPSRSTVFVEATGSGNEGYLIAYGAGSG